MAVEWRGQEFSTSSPDRPCMRGGGASGGRPPELKLIMGKRLHALDQLTASIWRIARETGFPRRALF